MLTQGYDPGLAGLKLLAAQAELEEDYALWMATLFPDYCWAPLSNHHVEFWEWVWSVQAGQRPRPFVGCWARGGAKSASVEMACVALGARRRRRYVLYVCHEKGTRICDPVFGWMNVEDHPTAEERFCEGYEVKIAGVSTTERVTPEHRYWARRIARRDRGHGTVAERMMTRPTWVEAQDLDWNTWLGLPIDRTVVDLCPLWTRWDYRRAEYVPSHPVQLDDPQFWWALGLWWGDGTLGGSRSSQISWATADAHPEVRDRLIAVLRKHGYEPKLHRRGPAACADIAICDSQFARWLHTWKVGRNRKEAPPWVERLPLEKQRELVRGYFDADGHITDRGAGLTSIHLPALMSMRRMLLRLGVVSTLVKARTPRESVIDGRTYNVQQKYRLDVRAGAEAIGFPSRPHKEQVLDLFIDDDCLWSRVKEVRPSGLSLFIPIQTATGEYTTDFARSHNCETQDQADEHVETIGQMLESARVEAFYPEMADRLVNKYGHSRGWRRSRLRTRSGFTIDALGLDKHARGVRFEDTRPDVLVLDDIDGHDDTPDATEKKVQTITRKLLPAGTAELAVLAMQNLVLTDGVFAKLVGRAEKPADFLTDRIVSGPFPALEDFSYVERDHRYVIATGKPTWEGQGIEQCQQFIDTWGISSFLSECQHDVEAPPGGMFDHLAFPRCTIGQLPELVRIVVWVDPAVTNKDSSDSQAIQADALGADGRIYRLRSFEGRTTPQDAIKKALRWAIELGAEKVGVETDQGGDTWDSVWREALREVYQDLELQRSQVPVILPRFDSRKAGEGYGSKTHRAAQMLADYERPGQQIVHVEGTHLVLERALRRFPKTKPLDLTDAAVWSWMDLRGRQRGEKQRYQDNRDRGRR